MSQPKYGQGTLCVSLEANPDDPYNPASTPIYQTATFKQSSAVSMGQYDYSRSGNPTRSAVEGHVARLMGAEQAYCVASGMSALDVITRMLKTGDEIIAGTDVYGGTNRLLKYIENLGIVTKHVDTTDLKAISAAMTPQTRLMLLESPTNPLIRICDLKALVKIARDSNETFHPDIVRTKEDAAESSETRTEHTENTFFDLSQKGCMVVVDNTMMSPYLQRPLEVGVDIVYHSGTKYLSGHHDLMAGVVGCRTKELAKSIYFVINATGVGLGPFESWLLLRGIKTLGVRMERQQQNAIAIADFLVSKDLKVNFPGLKTMAGYDIHADQSSGPGAVLSFETGSTLISQQIVEACKLFSISVSFGCVNSLISMPCRMSHASIPAEVRKERAMPEDLIRLCIGIEDLDDLLNDLKQALAEAGLD